MKYMLMIYSNEKAWQKLPEADQGRIYGEYMAYTEEMKPYPCAQPAHDVRGGPR